MRYDDFMIPCIKRKIEFTTHREGPPASDRISRVCRMTRKRLSGAARPIDRSDQTIARIPQGYGFLMIFFFLPTLFLEEFLVPIPNTYLFIIENDQAYRLEEIYNKRTRAKRSTELYKKEKKKKKSKIKLNKSCQKKESLSLRANSTVHCTRDRKQKKKVIKISGRKWQVRAR